MPYALRRIPQRTMSIRKAVNRILLAGKILANHLLIGAILQFEHKFVLRFDDLETLRTLTNGRLDYHRIAIDFFMGSI